MFGWRLADKALTEVRDMALKTATKLDSHTDECGRRYGSLEQLIAASVTERREHAVGLGKRLDRMDADNADIKKLGVKIFFSLLGGTILLLGAVAGLWLHAAGVIK